MYCQKCGTHTDGKFCPNCGAPTQEEKAEATLNGQPVSVAPQEPIKPKKKIPAWGKIAIAMAVVWLLIFAMFQEFGMSLMLASLIGFVVYLIKLIVSAVKKRSVKPMGIALALCFVLFVVGGISMSGDEEAQPGSSEPSVAAVAKNETERATEPADPVTKSEATEKKNNGPTEPYEDPLEKLERIYKDGCEKVSYKDVARNPDKYKGKQLRFTGEVAQVIESTWGTDVTLLVNVTKGEFDIYTDSIYVNYTPKSNGEDRILEDDIITIYGYFEGLTSYTSVLGAKITVPQIDGRYIDIKS